MLQGFLRYLGHHHMALIALFVALGGVSYAAVKLPANSVGTRQLKANSVIGSKVKNGSITGADVNASRLGKVPSAANADRATSAANASHATNADHATSADSASNASTATNADTLDGIDSTGFYQAGSKVADSNLLNGIASSGFYAAGSKVADSNLLDGKDSLAFGPPPTLVSYGQSAGSARTKFLDLNNLRLFATCNSAGVLSLDAETTLTNSFIAVSVVSDGPGSNTPVYVEKADFAPAAAFMNFLGTATNHAAGTLVFRGDNGAKIVTMNFQSYYVSGVTGYCFVAGTALAAG